jgi:hypothetical protein
MLLVANPAAANYPQFYAAQNAWRILKLFVPERIRSSRATRFDEITNETCLDVTAYRRNFEALLASD